MVVLEKLKHARDRGIRQLPMSKFGIVFLFTSWNSQFNAHVATPLPKCYVNGDPNAYMHTNNSHYVNGCEYALQITICMGQIMLNLHELTTYVSHTLWFFVVAQTLLNSGKQQRVNGSRKSESDQIKLNCPARVHIRDILVYTEYGVEGGLGLKHVKDPTQQPDQ